ncbi:MAG: hypothetical protein HGA19_10945 [Oscillochloris sp.]|nr:hypothetical protein [Oscillochloris sp.]
MARWIFLLTGAMMLALSLTSCVASALPALPTGDVRAQFVRDEVVFTLDSPANPRVNGTQHLRITLSDKDNKPVEATDVYFDMSMDMLCLSSSKPVANAIGHGSYEVDVVYVMAGDWKVTAVAEIDNRELRVTFPITVIN